METDFIFIYETISFLNYLYEHSTISMLLPFLVCVVHCGGNKPIRNARASTSILRSIQRIFPYIVTGLLLCIIYYLLL